MHERVDTKVDAKASFIRGKYQTGYTSGLRVVSMSTAWIPIIVKGAERTKLAFRVKCVNQIIGGSDQSKKCSSVLRRLLWEIHLLSRI